VLRLLVVATLIHRPARSISLRTLVSTVRQTPPGDFNNRRDDMSSRGKKKTTMAKLSRESKLRERRLEKQAKKNARKQPPVVHPGAPTTPEAG